MDILLEIAEKVCGVTNNKTSDVNNCIHCNNQIHALYYKCCSRQTAIVNHFTGETIKIGDTISIFTSLWTEHGETVIGKVESFEGKSALYPIIIRLSGQFHNQNNNVTIINVVVTPNCINAHKLHLVK